MQRRKSGTTPAVLRQGRRTARPVTSGIVVTRMVDSSGHVSFSGTMTGSDGLGGEKKSRFLSLPGRCRSRAMAPSCARTRSATTGGQGARSVRDAARPSPQASPRIGLSNQGAEWSLTGARPEQHLSVCRSARAGRSQGRRRDGGSQRPPWKWPSRDSRLLPYTRVNGVRKGRGVGVTLASNTCTRRIPRSDKRAVVAERYKKLLDSSYA